MYFALRSVEWYAATIQVSVSEKTMRANVAPRTRDPSFFHHFVWVADVLRALFGGDATRLKADRQE